jgi:hypothetical protein
VQKEGQPDKETPICIHRNRSSPIDPKFLLLDHNPYRDVLRLLSGHSSRKGVLRLANRPSVTRKINKEASGLRLKAVDPQRNDQRDDAKDHLPGVRGSLEWSRAVQLLTPPISFRGVCPRNSADDCLEMRWHCGEGGVKSMAAH